MAESNYNKSGVETGASTEPLENDRVEDLLERAELKFAIEKLEGFLDGLTEKKENVRELKCKYAALQEDEKEGENKAKIRGELMKIVSDLETEIPKVLEVADLPVVTQIIKEQKDLIQIVTSRTLAGRYEGFPFIKTGDSGWYFRARTIGEQRQKDVVVKVLKIMKTDDLEEQELVQVVEFDHPGIISIVDYNFKRLPAYIVLDFVHGITLDKALRMFGGFPLDVALSIMCGLIDSCNYVRKRKILHKNIRPSKIFIDHEGRPKISVVDIIKYEEDDLRSVSRFKEECKYLSEEALNGALDSDFLSKDIERSDQFSLGLLMLELIGYDPLFDAKTVSGIFSKRREFFDDPSKYLKEVFKDQKCSPQLREVISKMLSKEPGERYEDLSEVSIMMNQIKNQTLSGSPLLNSFDICCKYYPDWSTIFYRKLFKIYPHIESYFKDRKRQQLMLRFAIYVMFEIEQKEKYFLNILESERHKEFNTVEYFTTFLETLRETVRELVGDKWDEKTMLPSWNDKIQKTVSVVERYIQQSDKQ